MKKIAFLFVLISFCMVSYSFATCTQTDTSFACDSDPAWSVSLTKNVTVGFASAQATGAATTDPYLYFTLATGHGSGDKIYATSQSDTKIFVITDETPTSTEITGSALTPGATSPYDTAESTWKPL